MDAWAVVAAGTIALGGAALGIFNDVAKGWFTRKNTIEDKRTISRHRTAVDLQDGIFDLLRVNSQIFRTQSAAFKRVGRWDEAFVPYDLREQHRLQTARIGSLMVRLDEEPIRGQISEVLNRSLDVVQGAKESASVDAKTDLTSRAYAANEALGKVIRESWPD